MTWFDWVLVSLFAIGALFTISMIGKPRKPIDHATAVMTTVIDVLLILGVVLV